MKVFTNLTNIVVDDDRRLHHKADTLAWKGCWNDSQVEKSAGFLVVTLGLIGMIKTGTLIGVLVARILNEQGIGMLMPAYDSLVINKLFPEIRRSNFWTLC